MQKKRSERDEQRAITFDYYEILRSILRDLKSIDELIPRESSRHPLVIPGMSQNARYLIVARKDDLLGYIQTICRDHIEFGTRLLDAGWTPEHKRTWGKRKRAATKPRKRSER